MKKLAPVVVIMISLMVTAVASMGAANHIRKKDWPGMPSKLEAPIPIEAEGSDYIIFHKKDFKKKQGVQIMDLGAMQSVARAFGGKLKKQMKHVNGFVVTMPDKPNLVDLPDGWVASKVQIYHVPLATHFQKVEDLVCPDGQTPTCQSSLPSPTPCPGPSPGPGPVPQPNPTPVRPGTVSWSLDAVHALEAQALVDTSSMRIGVIDTGFDMTHPDRPKIRNAISMVDGSPVQDRAGHGTHCVGIISTGGSRIASGSKVEVDVCKGLNDNGSGTSVDLAECEVWMSNLNPPPDAVSMSWGGGPPDAAINSGINAMVARGIEVFIAAGNSGRTTNPGISNPALVGCTNPHVHAVLSSNQMGTIADYSSWGPCAWAIVPGSDVVSLRANGGTANPYVAMSGTSMATPLAAALWVTAKKAGKPLRFKSLGLPPNKQGQGQIDALLSVQ